MGNALDGCQKCKQAQILHTTNQLHEIPLMYKTRLTETNQISNNIPYYSNEIHYRLINSLKLRNQKYQDNLFPCQDLINDARVKWKRISQVYSNQPFCRAINNFYFQYVKKQNIKSCTRNLAQALFRLQNFPQLIKKLFANTQISNQGFYVLYFALGGNSQKRIEIVIDDYIPIDSDEKYLFQQPKQGHGIWMIILQKAWAKILRSYHNIENLASQYFFTEMTGVPLQQFYMKGDFLMSGQYDFQGNQSKYLKIYKQMPVKIIVCIWEPVTLDFTSLQSSQFVAQVITQKITPEQKQYRLLPLSTQKIGNKLILLNKKPTKQMFQLPKGQNIIHIFNKNRAKRSCNIIIHSRTPVNTHTRYQKQFKQAKSCMVINEYKKLHNQILVQYQYPGIQLRFCWLKHRGVFCLKNKSDQKKEIQMSIKKNFMNQIFFQDYNQLSKNLILSPKQYGFFVVIRAEDREYGHFYQILLNKKYVI